MVKIARCSHCNERFVRCKNCNNVSSAYLEDLIDKLEAENERLKRPLTAKEEINQELRSENKILQSSLGLREMEKSDLQAQIRGLETQLTEKESSGVGMAKVRRLEEKLNFLLEKIRSWKRLLERAKQKK